MISIKNLCVKLPKVEALKNINLEVKAGQRLGVVGESGSGKTMLGLCLLGITPDPAIISGTLKINNRNMLKASEYDWTKLRLNKIAMVFQEPMSALNPIKRIGDILSEPIRVHQNINYSKSKKKALSLLKEVGIPEVEIKINQFPHELSGGQRQRILIALALSCDPEILIADEPTSALDSTVALQITNLLVSLSKKRNMALVFISHDLNAVARTTQYLAVMFKGEIFNVNIQETQSTCAITVDVSSVFADFERRAGRKTADWSNWLFQGEKYDTAFEKAGFVGNTEFLWGRDS